MINSILNKLKDKTFRKKMGQSFVEYAIILGMLGIIVGTCSYQLYKSSKHNFYYGLLPTNQQNIDLPKGPDGQNGWFNDAYSGQVALVCEIENKIERVDDEGFVYYEYIVEAGQEVYCYDNSVNAVRNSWSKKYQEFSLSYNETKTLPLTIWDEYGVKYSTYAVITTNPREIETVAEKPIAKIMLNPEDDRYAEGDMINASASASQGYKGQPITDYEWKISDIYMGKKNPDDEKEVRLVQDDELGVNTANVTVKVVYEPNIESRARGTLTEVSVYPKGTRYIRLRVKSGGIWSDWTQKTLYVAENSRPIAVITSNVASPAGQPTKLNIIANNKFKVFNNKSYDPDFVELNGMIDLETSDEYLDNNKYVVNTNASTWTQAEANCRADGGHLATISSGDEQSLILNLIQETGMYDYWYIGGVKDTTDETWGWLTGETFSWTRWAYARPDGGPSSNEKYIAMYRNGQDQIVAGAWEDVTGTEQVGYVCEYEGAISTSIPNGITTFQWRLYKEINGVYTLDDPTPGSLVGEYALNEQIVDDQGFINLSDVGQYFLALRVQDEEGIWSAWPDPNDVTNYETTSYKYISVKMENLPPSLSLVSSPLPVDGEIKGTIATEYRFTPTIVHPEDADPLKEEHYMPTDYQDGYFTWIVRRPDGTIFDSGEVYDTSNDIELEKLGISGTFTIELKVCDASGAWSDTIIYTIKVIFATNYETTVKTDTFTMAELPQIPSWTCAELANNNGGCVRIVGDDISYSQTYSGNLIDLNFNFLAYGISFRYVDFSTNALVKFAKGYDETNDPGHTNLISYSTLDGRYSNTAVSDSYHPEYTLSAYWDDLYFGSPSGFTQEQKDQRLKYWVDNENQRLLIEYRNIGRYSSCYNCTDFNATVVISAAGYIDVYYLGEASWATGSSATIGIKGPSSKYTQYANGASNTVPKYTKLTFTPSEY